MKRSIFTVAEFKDIREKAANLSNRLEDLAKESRDLKHTSRAICLEFLYELADSIFDWANNATEGETK